MTFAVVTRIGSLQGNLASAMTDLYLPDETEKDEYGQSKYFLAAKDPRFLGLALAARIPVFHVGEVLILGDDGRELPYPGRKPSKWDITVEEFDTVGEAIARSQEAVTEDLEEQHP